jgi:hypothetical protein
MTVPWQPCTEALFIKMLDGGGGEGEGGEPVEAAGEGAGDISHHNQPQHSQEH